MNRKVVLTKRNLAVLTGQFGVLTCAKCGWKFRLGETIHSHQRSRGAKRREYYCLPCWESKYI